MKKRPLIITGALIFVFVCGAVFFTKLQMGDSKADSVMDVKLDDLILNRNQVYLREGLQYHLYMQPESQDTIINDKEEFQAAMGEKTVWKSSDEAVATVDEDGRITAVSPGESTVSVELGQKTHSCKVVVLSKEEDQEVPIQYNNEIFTKDLYEQVVSMDVGPWGGVPVKEVTSRYAMSYIYSLLAGFDRMEVLSKADTEEGRTGAGLIQLVLENGDRKTAIPYGYDMIYEDKQYHCHYPKDSAYGQTLDLADDITQLMQQLDGAELLAAEPEKDKVQDNSEGSGEWIRSSLEQLAAKAGTFSFEAMKDHRIVCLYSEEKTKKAGERGGYQLACLDRETKEIHKTKLPEELHGSVRMTVSNAGDGYVMVYGQSGKMLLYDINMKQMAKLQGKGLPDGATEGSRCCILPKSRKYILAEDKKEAGTSICQELNCYGFDGKKEQCIRIFDDPDRQMDIQYIWASDSEDFLYFTGEYESGDGKKITRCYGTIELETGDVVPCMEEKTHAVRTAKGLLLYEALQKPEKAYQSTGTFTVLDEAGRKTDIPWKEAGENAWMKGSDAGNYILTAANKDKKEDIVVRGYSVREKSCAWEKTVAGPIQDMCYLESEDLLIYCDSEFHIGMIR